MLLQQSSTATAIANNIIKVDNQGKNLNNPDGISVNALRCGDNAALVSNCLGGGSSLFELGSNALRGIRNHKSGYDHKSACRYFLASLHEIQEMADERERMVQSHPEGKNYELLMAEGKVLQDLQKSYQYEFMRFQQSVTAASTYENMNYALNLAANSVGLSSVIYSLKSLKHNKFAGTSNILLVASSAIFLTAPFLCHLSSKLAEEHAHSRLVQQLHEDPHTDYQELKATEMRFEELYTAEGKPMSQAIGPIEGRLALYSEDSGKFEGTLSSETQTLLRLRKVALQSEGLGLAINGASLAQSILFTTSYYRYGRKVPQTFHDKKMSNAINYSGNIAALSGNSFSFAATCGLLVGNIIYTRKLAREKLLPADLIKDRLEWLDKLEQQIKAM